MVGQLRYPAPLRPGDRIGITAPSSGVEPELRPRLDVAVDWLRDKGFDVEVGQCIGTPSHTSAPKQERAAELMRMLTDPAVRAVVPPWGGETGIDVLDLLDYDAIGAAEPTWCVGYSDTSTWLTPLTLRTGVATIHGQNLMDTPYRSPAGIRHWLDIASAPVGATIEQHSPGRYRASGWDDWESDPHVDEYTLDTSGTWSRIDPGHEDEPLDVSGRLVGGCVETLSCLTGTAFGDVGTFARSYAPDGLVHLLDISEWGSVFVCRVLHGMRLAGWFDQANAILVSRTQAPETPDFTQRDAVLDALGGLGVPIVVDVECGHVAPQLALVNGAPTSVTLEGTVARIEQRLA